MKRKNFLRSLLSGFALPFLSKSTKREPEDKTEWLLNRIENDQPIPPGDYYVSKYNELFWYGPGHKYQNVRFFGPWGEESWRQ